MRPFLQRCGLVLMMSVGAWAARADDVVKYPQPPNFARYAYHYALLEEVLKRTIAEYGPYTKQPYTIPLSTDRIATELSKGELVNVMALDVGNEFVNMNAIPVPYPIDKGLLGYRVALIRKERAAEFAAIDTLEELRAFTVGRGTGWGDVKIFQHNGIRVETAPKYESLFKMLDGGRFDLFPRGVTEAPQELAMFGKHYPDLVIADRLLIKYRYAQFFYVSRAVPRLAERIAAGLEAMIADGSLDALFDKHFAKAIADLKLDKRTTITLDNPFLPDWVPLDRKELWF
jgi:hypothetical protein